MKKLVLLFVLLIPALALADPGVIVSAKGKVTVNQAPAKTGTKFSDGSLIDVGIGGAATLMFSNGEIKKLAGGEKYKAEKSASGESAGGTPLIKGIAMAYNDATTKSSGPTVHGMVKAAGGTSLASNSKLDPSRAKQMKSDLAQINTLGLDKDGKALMQAQVYYKYQQYQSQVNTLLPVYKTQKPPTEMVKGLIALGYEKMGKPEEASKYK